ncbi:ubiquitin-like protein 7 [Clytia hemisphaerica]|uniref:Ubiquitin-like domain-containing protein n=1 Tax=Clytia hemisphaerica TaxID=252671 RepID=A0A7M5XEE4_9CNID
MASRLVVTDPFAKSKKTIDEIDLASSLTNFKKSVYVEFGVKVEDQELLYLGQILEDDEKSLQSYGVQNETTIYLFKKLPEEEPQITEMRPTPSIDEISSLLAKAKNPAFKTMLKKFFQKKENIEKILNENENLKNDDIVAALLRDSDLSAPVLESLTPERIVNEFPNLALALKLVLSKLSATDSIGRRDLLQDGEDYEGIDPAYLAQAELMASNEAAIQQNQQQQQSSASSQQNAQQISAADLANALSFATMTQDPATPSSLPFGSPGSQPNRQPQPDFTAGIEQMRTEFNISEDVARRALVMTNGNVQMAVNLVFDGSVN